MESDMSFELAGGPYAVTAARLALADLDSHLDPSVAFDVRLLVSELVTNSVQHAQVAAEDSIVLAVKLGDESVRVEVRDDGPGFEPPAAPPPDDADAGWGLFLVEQLADSWGVGEDRKGVWFEIRRDRAREGEPGSESESTAA
ncbi:MAG: serine/threonine-protein kinase RsbW [Thermoleophilaceae bacterium]|jgi:anti-sigma regulatory factor (Ser/Thr protein kinase)|nr:serine/threonine-protein kinase RsbW [Thermoleophilaceae bacterium]